MGDSIEAGAITNDWEAARVVAKGGIEQQAHSGLRWVIEPHIDFTADDVFFHLEFIFGQRRPIDHFGENVEKFLHTCGGAIYVINGAIKGGVGIPVTTSCLHDGGESGTIIGGGAFENHVFEKMGETCA